MKRRGKSKREGAPGSGTLVVEADGDDLMARVISGPVRGASSETAVGEREKPGRIDGIAIGRLVRATGRDGFEVDYPDNPEKRPLTAISTVALRDDDVGREVALAFEAGDPRKPVVLGRIHRSAAAPAEAPTVEGEVDGETLTFTADKQIVLRCGKASITLTRAGKILIRGAYLSNRSSGVNRIKGGSVHIN